MRLIATIMAAIAVLAMLLIAACRPPQPNQPPAPPQQPPAAVAECASDSDCAVGGCSGQVCTTKDKAAGLITTCEFKPEYGCLKLTSCGCVEGKCSWKQTESYKACVEQARRQQ